MFNFKVIDEINSRLTDSLINWANPDDGFYRSAPLMANSSSPSFTNTGIVLQAFNESGRNFIAHSLASKLMQYYNDQCRKPFPNEHAKVSHRQPHVMSNSWAVFAMMDCDPKMSSELIPILDWFISNQYRDGHWGLLPHENTQYPIFTAYALSVLLQFNECFNKLAIHKEYLPILKKYISVGFNYILSNRLAKAMKDQLLLWPVKIEISEDSNVSFCTSAICMHMLKKAPENFKSDNWDSMVESTFRIIVESFDSNGDDCFTYDGKRHKIWQNIHANDSSLNYAYAFFAPIHLITLLKFTDQSNLYGSNKYWLFIKYMTDWIIENSKNVDGKYGVLGAKTYEDVKTWSTAQAVIVLSRLLKISHRLNLISDNNVCQNQFCIQIYQEISSTQLNNTIKRKCINISWAIYLALSFCFMALLILLFGDTIQRHWPRIEGYVWFIGSILTAIFYAFSITLKKIPKKIINIISERIMDYWTLIKIFQYCKKYQKQ
ncbi:MAG: hypothetical protein AB1641_05845 [Thermodesulfobacteriota bacterium]